MGNGKSVGLQLVLNKLEKMDKRLKRVEEKVSSAVELELVARKLAEETAEMKSKSIKYLSEKKALAKYK